jgi:glycosyltransferase involved in cell wall biosynthesis
VSEEDAEQLARLGGNGIADRLAVVPNGVDLARFAAGQVPDEPRVLFPGTLHYSPNVDGAVWFCSEIWPLVREQVPEASLVLAGRDPSVEVHTLAQIAGVEVHADVPSMVPYFEAARVVVVPLRIGTGTRLKALEAMASGRPVVGTSEGLAGLGIRDGVQARVADEPAEFAAAVAETLRRDDLAAALGTAGRRHVEQQFGWDAIGEQFVSTVADLVEREPR